mmetsp:Transcript_6302/g.13878  ORF Transcript_6302/g.13878 Transcript_6302/m.13878 type:complete len:84 (+) Transcript_6302:473-724(+)
MQAVPVVQQVIQVWPPPPPFGTAPVFLGATPVDGSLYTLNTFHFAGPPADAKLEAAAFIGYMVHAAVPRCHMIATPTPLGRLQ